MRSLRPFIVGLAAAAVVVYGGAAALAVVAQAEAWRELTVALGPVPLLEVRSGPAATETTFGSGLALASLAGGVLNAAAAWLLGRGR